MSHCFDCADARPERDADFDFLDFITDPANAGFAEMLGTLLRGIASAQDCELWIKRKRVRGTTGPRK